MKTADALSTLHSLALLPPLDLGGGHMERIQGCLAWFKVSSNSTSAPLGSVFPNLTTPVGSPPSLIASMVSTIPFTLSGPRDLCLYIILYYKAFFTRMLPYPQTGLSVLGGQRRHLISTGSTVYKTAGRFKGGGQVGVSPASGKGRKEFSHWKGSVLGNTTSSSTIY